MEKKIKRILDLKMQEKKIVMLEIQLENSIKQNSINKMNELNLIKENELNLTIGYDISSFLKKTNDEYIKAEQCKSKCEERLDCLKINYKEKTLLQKRFNNLLNKIKHEKNLYLLKKERERMDEWFSRVL